MSRSRSLTPLDASEYEQIASAVQETARGRWFLAEYARRNRHADTGVLLGAIHRLEAAVAPDRAPESIGVGRLRGDLMEMAGAIARTRAEVAALNGPEHGESRLTVASGALDAIVRATERATSDILGAAEEVQEAAWTLRETGADTVLCDSLDRHATQIYTACSFQDLTAQRTGRIVHTLRYLEDRITAMIGIWGGDEIPLSPEAAGRHDVPASDLDQSDVDRFLGLEVAPEPAPQAPTRRPLDDPASIQHDLTFLPTASEPTASEPTASGPAQPVPPPAPAALEVPPPPPPPAEPEAAKPVLAAVARQAETPSSAERGDPAIRTRPTAMQELSGDLAGAFPDLDALSIEEKIALFS